MKGRRGGIRTDLQDYEPRRIPSSARPLTPVKDVTTSPLGTDFFGVRALLLRKKTSGYRFGLGDRKFSFRRVPGEKDLHKN